MTPYEFVLSSCGIGASDYGTEDGPRHLKKCKLLKDFKRYDVAWGQEITTNSCDEKGKKITDPQARRDLVYAHALQLYDTVSDVLQRQKFPVVLGGDNTCSVSTWPAIIHNINAYQEFGLLWIDAHMDSHTPATSPSQSYHGMPLAMLFGYGDDDFCAIGGKGAKLNPEHVCLLGTRSYEAGEHELLQRLGVRIFFQEEIDQRGPAAVIKEAHAIIDRAPKGYGVMIDLDGFDPHLVPGVGTPVKGGLGVADTMLRLRAALKSPKLKGFEICEYNPHLDQDKYTLDAIESIVREFLWVRSPMGFAD